MEHIQFLDLRPCGRSTLCSALEQLPNLHRLRHIKCKGQTLTPADCKLLGDAARRSNGVLRMINIESCRVSDEGGMELADTGTLETICIRLNALTDVAIERFAFHLLHRQLQVLNLKGNRVTDSGVLSLCEVLGQCQHLRVLNLRNNKVTCSGASALAEAIQFSSCGVKLLRLSSNLIRDAGVQALCRVLPKLDELDLAMNKFSRPGKDALKEAWVSAKADGLNPVVFPVPEVPVPEGNETNREPLDDAERHASAEDKAAFDTLGSLVARRAKEELRLL